MKHLSRKDIEAIAERIVKAYSELPEVKKNKNYRIEPELLLTKLLGSVDKTHNFHKSYKVCFLLLTIHLILLYS